MIVLAITAPLLVALQLWLAGPGRHCVGNGDRLPRMHLCPGSPVERFVKTLGLPKHIKDITIRMPAGQVATMTVTWSVGADEIDALSEWYRVEGIQRRTYGLVQRQPGEVGKP